MRETKKRDEDDDNDNDVDDEDEIRGIIEIPIFYDIEFRIIAHLK